MALSSLLQDTGARKEYLMEEGGLRRSARKKQLTLKAELNVATEVKFAEWKSWQGKDHRSGKEKPIAVDSEDDTPPKWKRKRAGMSLRSREEIDWSEEEEEGEEEGDEEERGEGERMTCKSPMAERKTKQTRGRSRPKKTKVNLECESRDEQSKLGGLGTAETNEGGGCTKGEAPSGVGVGEERAEEGGEDLPTEGCWSHFRDLCEMLPGRRPQIELLLTLFGEVRSHLVPYC